MTDCYKVANLDWNQSLPGIYSTFTDALEVQKSVPDYKIYYVSENEHTEVWNPEWETYDMHLEAKIHKVNMIIKEMLNGTK